MRNLFYNPAYSIIISFKSEREPIEGVMLYREYRRMVRNYHAGQGSGTYKISIENTRVEVTFPLEEIDTIHAAEAAKNEPGDN